jgi:hypothetical protein
VLCPLNQNLKTAIPSKMEKSNTWNTAVLCWKIIRWALTIYWSVKIIDTMDNKIFAKDLFKFRRQN